MLHFVHTFAPRLVAALPQHSLTPHPSEDIVSSQAEKRGIAERKNKRDGIKNGGRRKEGQEKYAYLLIIIQ